MGCNIDVPRGTTMNQMAAPKAPPQTPAYFQRALRADAAAHAAFKSLSPSHKREYIEWITEAKTDATRERRIVTAIEWLVQGKSRNWKYERSR